MQKCYSLELRPLEFISGIEATFHHTYPAIILRKHIERSACILAADKRQRLLNMGQDSFSVDVDDHDIQVFDYHTSINSCMMYVRQFCEITCTQKSST